jgi:uncharacterized membrane protein
VSLIPFSTEWIAESRLAPAQVVVYAAVFILVNITYVAQCWEAVVTIGVFAAAAVIAV